MSLLPIVRALGGVLYDRGSRAVVPGPGHSAGDRSVSLWLSDGRLIVHSFGRSTWREVLDELRGRGFIDAHGRPAAGTGKSWAQKPPASPAIRSAVARRIWSEAQPLVRQPSMAYVRNRLIDRSPPVSAALRHHPALQQAVYADRGRRRPALLAAITAPDGEICAVEATYLELAGRRASDLLLSRKVIGALPSGCAVRLDSPGPDFLVGEGVFTTLSASRRFGLPGWALLSTCNLRAWSAPSGVRRVLIAGDRGDDGERSAEQLRHRLVASGVAASIRWPPPPAGDWNEAEAEEGRGEGGTGCAKRRDGL